LAECWLSLLIAQVGNSEEISPRLGLAGLVLITCGDQHAKARRSDAVTVATPE
jgi:hypothetical protein